MPWIDKRAEMAKAERDDFALVEELRRDDDGELLGAILRFYEDGPTYAWTMTQRIGPCTTDAAARRAVEERIGT